MASKIRVTKVFDFEAAHALWNYNGQCSNLHGHSYKLYVTVIGTPTSEGSNPKNGMVMDFGDLKEVVNREIVSQLDHAVILNRAAMGEETGAFRSMLDKCYIVDYQPTCENLVADFAHRIAGKLPEGVSLYRVRLDETATSYAEWFASDNP